MKRFGTIVLVLAGFIAGIAFVYSCNGGGSSSNADVAALEARIEALEYTLSSAYMTTETINGVAGPHLILSGVNVHIQNGSAQTDTNNGLGNLIMGYNEWDEADTTNRSGSHNLIIGLDHEYTSYGGLVTGMENKILAPYASISGGEKNIASGVFASVSGGGWNEASGDYASISGGTTNIASGQVASISGGEGNVASSPRASVSGGRNNVASHNHSTISGGQNLATAASYDHIP
jgi:hypothetical protein